MSSNNFQPEELGQLEEAAKDDGLYELAIKWRDSGVSQIEIYRKFEAFRNMLRNENRDADEDLIMDAMDCIVGWCGPHRKIFSHYLTNEDMRGGES